MLVGRLLVLGSLACAALAAVAGSASAQAPRAATPGAGDMASWKSALVAHVLRYRQYPRAARESNAEGTAYLRFTVDRNGLVVSRHIQQSSGHEALDGEAMDILTRAQPLPAPPANVPGAQFEFLLPLAFKLTEPPPPDTTSWPAALLAHLSQQRHYPPDAKAKGQAGTAFVRFSTDRRGQILSQSIARSSGHAALDSAAMELISRSQPLPAPPASLRGERFDFVVPIRFSLDRPPVWYGLQHHLREPSQ